MTSGALIIQSHARTELVHEKYTRHISCSAIAEDTGKIVCALFERFWWSVAVVTSSRIATSLTVELLAGRSPLQLVVAPETLSAVEEHTKCTIHTHYQFL